jgi:hypothetical protein
MVGVSSIIFSAIMSVVDGGAGKEAIPRRSIAKRLFTIGHSSGIQLSDYICNQ